MYVKQTLNYKWQPELPFFVSYQSQSKVCNILLVSHIISEQPKVPKVVTIYKCDGRLFNWSVLVCMLACVWVCVCHRALLRSGTAPGSCFSLSLCLSLASQPAWVFGLSGKYLLNCLTGPWSCLGNVFVVVFSLLLNLLFSWWHVSSIRQEIVL